MNIRDFLQGETEIKVTQARQVDETHIALAIMHENVQVGDTFNATPELIEAIESLQPTLEKAVNVVVKPTTDGDGHPEVVSVG